MYRFFFFIVLLFSGHPRLFICYYRRRRRRCCSRRFFPPCPRPRHRHSSFTRSIAKKINNNKIPYEVSFVRRDTRLPARRGPRVWPDEFVFIFSSVTAMNNRPHLHLLRNEILPWFYLSTVVWIVLLAVLCSVSILSCSPQNSFRSPNMTYPSHSATLQNSHNICFSKKSSQLFICSDIKITYSILFRSIHFSECLMPPIKQ